MVDRKLKCTGCKMTWEESGGYVECDEGLIWCFTCGFKLKFISSEEFRTCRHWHGYDHRLFPVFNLEGDIEFVSEKKKIKISLLFQSPPTKKDLQITIKNNARKN